MSKSEEPPPSYKELSHPSAPPSGQGTQYWQSGQQDFQSSPYSGPQPVQYAGQPGAQQVQYVGQAGAQPVQYVGQPGQTVVIMQQPQPVLFRDVPLELNCQFCHQQITTRLEYKGGFEAWLWCVIISILGGVLGCCLIPFFCRPCQDVQHHCPQCGKVVGMYKKAEAAQAAHLQRRADYLNNRSKDDNTDKKWIYMHYD